MEKNTLLGGENTVSGHIWFNLPQIQIPFSVMCLECKSEYSAVQNTQLLKCKCGHVISVKVMLEGQRNIQDLAGARKMPENPFLKQIRNKPPPS